MSQNTTINTPQDYVNYTFNIQARGAAEVSSELVGLSNTVGNILGQLAFKTSEFLSHTEMLAIGTGAAISAAFVSAAKDAIHFEQQIANVQAIGGESINARAIGNAAMEYSNKFGMATAQMTEGLEALARAGITSTNIMKQVLEEGVKLSKLEDMDLEDSINNLISTTNLLSQDTVDMNASDYGELVKAMNQHIVSTSESAPINAQNIIQTLQHVGGYASASGIDQDDLFAVIAQLGARGTKGEMAGTALRAFIAAGQKDTAQRALARIGLDVGDLWDDNGNIMLPISEMKNVLDEALEARGYSKQEKLEFYSDFAGYKQANQIMKIDTAEVEKYKSNIANAWDLGKKLDTILGTVRGNLDRIWQTAQNFMTKVGTKILGVMNAIATPIRIILDLFTKIPFADTAVAAGLLFVGFRTGLMIFNKLVPAVSGFMTGLNDARDNTRGFRGEWEKTREEVQQTKDIINMIFRKDQQGLVKLHYKNQGLAPEDKAFVEERIAAQMYLGSIEYKRSGLEWNELDKPQQHQLIAEYKLTKEFKENYDEYIKRMSNFTESASQQPIKITDFSNNTDTYLKPINEYVQYIFNLLDEQRDEDRQNGRRNRQGGNRGSDRGSGGGPGRGSGGGPSGGSGGGSGGGFGSGANVNDVVVNQVHKIFDNINKEARQGHYGNYEFAYRDDVNLEQLKKDINNAYASLEKKIKMFSNLDATSIEEEQRKVYKKYLFREAMNYKGRKYSERSNESEIRLALEKGIFVQPPNASMGITDAQIKEIARIAQVDISHFSQDSRIRDDRKAILEHIYNEISEQGTKKVDANLIDNITIATNKKWQDYLDKLDAEDKISKTKQKLFIDNPQIAIDIADALNIQTTAMDAMDAVFNHFRDEANRNDAQQVNIATDIIFNALKQQAQNNNNVLTLPEQYEIQYVIENLKKLENTVAFFQTSDTMSEALKDELNDMKEIMEQNWTTMEVGGAQLGDAIVNGFIRVGLGRESPGYMAHAVEDEMNDIKNALNKGMKNIDSIVDTGVFKKYKEQARKHSTYKREKFKTFSNQQNTTNNTEYEENLKTLLNTHKIIRNSPQGMLNKILPPERFFSEEELKNLYASYHNLIDVSESSKLNLQQEGKHDVIFLNEQVTEEIVNQALKNIGVEIGIRMNNPDGTVSIGAGADISVLLEEINNLLNNQGNQHNTPSERREKENNRHIRQLLNSLVINQGQRGIIQKLLTSGKNDEVIQEIKKTNKNINDDDIEKIVKHLMKNPNDLNNIKTSSSDDDTKEVTLIEQLLKDGWKKYYEGVENAKRQREEQKKRWDQQRQPYEDANRERREEEAKKDKQRREERERRRAEDEAEREKRKKAHEEREHDTAKQNVSIEYNYWEKLRQRISQALDFKPPGSGYWFGGEFHEYEQTDAQKQTQKILFKIVNFGESGEKIASSFIKNIGEKLNTNAYYRGNIFKETSDAMSDAIQPAKEFASILNQLSETFTFLAPIAAGVDTAVSGGDTIIKALSATSDFLDVTRDKDGARDKLKDKAEKNPYAKLLYNITGLKDSNTKIGKSIWTLISNGTKRINNLIGAQLLPLLPSLVPLLLPIIAIIGTIIVTIKAIQFWENKHAQALKETQAALKESVAEANTAFSQYKDLKQARENETDAIKRQQKARREAIALYNLESARIKRRKLIYDEANLRNHPVWGEYGYRANLQKMGWLESIMAGGIPFLGTIMKSVAGEFESQYENYDGTTKNIRQIKENTLGNVFATSEQRKMSKFYDDYSHFFAEIEGFKDPLQKLYAKESELIERYGSIEDARATKEFKEAVQEFSDATGVNGEVAGKMLDWLETENKVDKAVQVGQAEIAVIMARRQAELMKIQYGDEYEDVDFNDVGNAMLMAQFQEMMNAAKTEIWWDLLFGYLDTVISALNPLNWISGEVFKKLATLEANQQTLAELDAQGNSIYNNMLEAYEKADRRDYGTDKLSSYNDTPFSGAIAASKEAYADEKQKEDYQKYGVIYSGDEYKDLYENHDIYLKAHLEASVSDSLEQEKQYIQNESQAIEISLKQDMQQAGEQGVEGFKEGLDQHSPGAISRSVQDEMLYSEEFITEATPLLSEYTHNLGIEMSNSHKNALSIFVNTQSEMEDSEVSIMTATPDISQSTFDLGTEMSESHKDALVIADNTQTEMTNVNNTIENSKDIINPTAYDAGYEAGQEYSKGFKEGLKDLYDQISTPEALEESLKEHILYRQGLAERPTSQTTPQQQNISSSKSLDAIDIFEKLLPQSPQIQIRKEPTGGINKSFYDFIEGKKDFGIFLANIVNKASPSTFPLIKSGNDYVNAALGYETYDMRIGTQASAPPAQGPYGQFYEYVEGKQNPITKAFYKLRRNIYDNSSTSKKESDDSLEETTVKATADTGSFILSDFIERVGSKIVTKGNRKITNTILGKIGGEVAELLTKITGKTIFKSGAKTAGKIAPFIGPLITAGYAVAEHNPFEKHYNEDGSEKRAFQATGEVVGETAGAVIATGLGLAVEGILTGATFGLGAVPAAIIGAGVEMVAGAILEPIGEAIGGTIGWMVDEIVNTPIKDLWGGFNDALGGIPGQVVDFIDQSPIGQAGHWAFDQLNDLTGGWLGDTWEYVSNSSIAQLTGLDQLGNVLQGVGEWLFGTGEDEQIPTPDQITDEQIMELEKAGMLDDYLAAYGLDKDQKNIFGDKAKISKTHNNSETTIVIKNININTEDDPEKIKSAFMNLMIELQEQISPRQVSRTIGELPAASTDTTTDPNNQNQAEGTDPNNPNATNNNSNNNTNPTT